MSLKNFKIWLQYSAYRPIYILASTYRRELVKHIGILIYTLENSSMKKVNNNATLQSKDKMKKINR